MPIIWAMKLMFPLVLAFSVLPAFGMQEGLASWYGGKFNGRGPFVEGRIIDLSRAAAQDMDMVAKGVASVSPEVLDFARGPCGAR